MGGRHTTSNTEAWVITNNIPQGSLLELYYKGAGKRQTGFAALQPGPSMRILDRGQALVGRLRTQYVVFLPQRLHVPS